ncbi:MAG TPA: hypothetical protein VFI75_03780 [Candidatus Acidoferrum sp.]|jgi:hypothetical protein|nr:hypothetical protein [Candidatus Acidoferrum sp.]
MRKALVFFLLAGVCAGMAWRYFRPDLFVHLSQTLPLRTYLRRGGDGSALMKSTFWFESSSQGITL